MSSLPAERRWIICGTIRLKTGERIRPGGDLSMRLANGKILSGPWEGFMREETYDRLWSRSVALGVLLDVAGYEEHEQYFPVPRGLLIQAGWCLADHTIKIMTRRASGLLEVQTHHRHPKFVAA